MTHGFDTSFLVAAEVSAHTDHISARTRLTMFRQIGDRFALAPQVLSEFVHVVTDTKRFSHPLPVELALERAEIWWNSPEVEQVRPDDSAMVLFFKWMTLHSLGRKRVLDTLLAATYRSAGIDSVLTTNARDFSIFGGFTCIAPTMPPK